MISKDVESVDESKEKLLTKKLGPLAFRNRFVDKATVIILHFEFWDLNFSAALETYTETASSKSTYLLIEELKALEVVICFLLAIEFSIKALNLFPSNNKIKNNLIDIFNYVKPKNNTNLILQTNSQILKLNLENNNDKFVKISSLSKILNKSYEILRNNNLDFNYPHVQIFKKNTKNYECERHLQIFSEQRIIPKFCFSCYKVQITLNNVLELLKLYFYFNNLNLDENNIRKCIVELRNNVDGNYKGYIFCKSIEEAKNIKKIINSDLEDKRISVNKIEIKHGCTEYYEQFELYKNIDEDVQNKIYQKKWNNIEQKFNERNLIEENNKERVFGNSIKLFNLPDFLIIKNWLIYAKVLGDSSYEKLINFELDINNLSKLEIEKINLRKKYLVS